MTAINQSGLTTVSIPSTSSIITSPPPSPVFSPATGLLPYIGGPPPRHQSFLPLLPFNLLQFRQPLLPLPVLPMTTVPSLGGRRVSLDTPTANLSLMRHNIMGMSPVTGMGMSPAIGTGMSPATSEGVSGVVVTRKYSNSRASDNESNVSVDDPTIQERVTTRETRSQRLSNSSSSSSLNSSDHIITNDATNLSCYGSRLLKAESPTSQEDAADKILALSEVCITQYDTGGPSGVVPTQRNPLQLLSSPISFLPQSFSLRAGLSSAYSPLLAYPSSAYMPLLVANQPQGLGSIINPGATTPLLRTVLPTQAGASFLPNTLRHIAINQPGIVEQSISGLQESQARQGSNSNTGKPTTDSSSVHVHGKRKTITTPISANNDGIISTSFQERMISQPLPPPPSLRPLREDEHGFVRSPPALIRIEQLESSQSKRRKEMKEETAKKERIETLEDLPLERENEKVSSSSTESMKYVHTHTHTQTYI